MPTLKQITCNVEWSGSKLPLHEYQTVYADGYVETYVAVPSVPTPFSIHLRSHGYIASGLAMFVYMDGDYQCNRNRSNLKIPSEARTWKQTEVDFHVRQKEELMPDGSFSGKQWRFEPLKTAMRLTPYDAQYIGTIEVVILRCYPTQISPRITPSSVITESVPFARSQEPRGPLAVDSDTAPSSSSDEESSNSDGVGSVMGGMFDGANDHREHYDCGSFGGDMALDQSSPNQGKTQPRRSPYVGSTFEKGENRHSGNHSNTPIRYEHVYDTPNSQKWHNRVAPDRSGQNQENIKPQSFSSSSGRHNHPEHGNNTPNSQNRVSRTSPGTKSHAPYSGNDSNERSSASYPSRHSPAGSAAVRSSSSATWVQPQGPPAPVAPAVVINVTHGTPNSANLVPANNPALNAENTKVDVWQNPSQPDKIDEYLQGTNQSPEGSNESKASKRSNNLVPWPSQTHNAYEQPSENEDNYQWHETTAQNENNENQWAAVEDTSEPNWGQTNSNYQNENNTWENKIVDSQPVESSSMEAQNPSNGWSSNENNNVSWDTAGEASTGNKQAQPEVAPAWTPPTYTKEGKPVPIPGSWQPDATDVNSGHAANSRNSMPSSPQGQGQQHPSPHPSHKSTTPKRNWVNDFPNSQYQRTTNYETPTHDVPQPWSEQVVEPNNHELGSPPAAAAPQIHGPVLPILIDPRPRPYWSAWRQPKNNSNASKATVPRVEPAEPLYYVPSDIAERNKMSHQVHVSQPAEYVHKRASPRYMDDFNHPYAVFVFKYRSRAILEQILNTTLIEPEAHEKERLLDLSKEELIEQVLKANAYKNNTNNNNNTPANRVPSGESSSTHTLKPQPQTYAVHSSDNTSTNPEHHWGRGTPILNTAPPHPDAKVTSWLGGGGGGGGDHHTEPVW